MKKILLIPAFVFVLSACSGSSSSSSSSYSESPEGYGEYHNIQTGEQQTSYKNSVEQQEDIAVLDKMIEDGY